MKYAREGSGRYDRLHGDEDDICVRAAHSSSCPECGSTDGCLCGELARQDAMLDRYEREHPKPTGHPCCMCGCDPCESLTGCAAEARRENEETEDSDG